MLPRDCRYIVRRPISSNIFIAVLKYTETKIHRFHLSLLNSHLGHLMSLIRLSKNIYYVALAYRVFEKLALIINVSPPLRHYSKESSTYQLVSIIEIKVIQGRSIFRDLRAHVFVGDCRKIFYKNF